MKKKTLFGLLTVVTVLVFLFSACGGGVAPLPEQLKLEDLEGDWDWVSTRVDLSGERGENQQYGGINFTLDQNNNLNSVMASVFEVGDVNNINSIIMLRCFSKGDGTYEIKNNQLMIENKNDISEVTATLTVNQGIFTGEMVVDLVTYSNHYEWEFTLSKKENADFEDIVGAWDLNGEYKSTEQRGFFVGKLYIPEDVQVGDLIELQITTGDVTQTKTTTVTSLYQYKPRCFSFNTTSDNGGVHYSFKYTDEGTIKGQMWINNGDNWESYLFEGEPREITIEDFKGPWDWESTQIYDQTDQREENLLNGRLLFEFDEQRVLESVQFNVFEVEDITSPTRMNGELFNKSEGTYEMTDNQLVLTNDSDFWISRATITIDNGKYTGYHEGELAMSTVNYPNYWSNYTFKIRKEPNVELSDFEGTWDLSGQGSVGEENTIMPFIGKLNIPAGVSQGDIVEFEITTNDGTYNEDLTLYSIDWHLPRCIRLYDLNMNSFNIKLNKNGTIQGISRVTKSETQKDNYLFEGTKQE